jgi:uncharacterized repeat protein (TIGR03837 family)
MLWDIFCKVIDNFGDIGVCWRLSRDMASRGHEVRLWVDDDSALRWMAPHVNAHGHGEPGVTVQHWPADEATMPEVDPGDVVIEAFGCNPPDGFVARMQRPAPPRWVNLEYLSAEGYVERSHGLSSPVWSGPGYGLKKRFFYPGFTSRTGGLLREPPLLLKRDAFAGSAAERERWLSSLGVSHQPQERLVTLFCYAQSPVSLFLDALSQSNVPCHVLLTPGHATEQAMAWQPPLGSTLRLSRLSALPQPEFDRLLWCTDLNIVRGEDSAVRALWAAKPHVWQIYRQDDGVHADKLQAFMDLWMHDWPPALRQQVETLWRAFNGLAAPDELAGALRTLWAAPDWADWQAASARSSRSLAAQTDLVTQLLEFVTQPG